MRILTPISFGLFLGVGLATGAADVPVPDRCTPEVNARLAELIQSGTRRKVDNVMVCGVTTRAAKARKGGQHGAHEILSVSAQLPGLGTRLVQIAINDALDGAVSAPANATVFAYGQAYFDNTGRFVAGIHDVHCSTHSGADNGWIVVNGNKSPALPCH